jgi:hypothetical protein
MLISYDEPKEEIVRRRDDHVMRCLTVVLVKRIRKKESSNIPTTSELLIFDWLSPTLATNIVHVNLQ